ncbi:MAG TPA: type VI secretion system-associated FHA domain protein TagH, partial [Rhodocyclaceae bacterium]|nr:type VI secretion system-associated FHA domain protein TagH [Rhodocyclaceae bacterium]
ADPFADILNGVTASPSPQPQVRPAPAASAPPQPAAADPLAGVWSPPARTPTESESLSELLAAPLPAGPAMPNNRAPLIPDDFDPFADPFAVPPKTAEPEALDDDLGFGLAGKSGSGSSIDTAYGLAAPPPVGNGIDPFLGSSLSDPLAGRGGDAPIDPLAAFSGDLGAPIPGFQSMPDQVPELHGAFVPPRVEPFAAPEPGAFAADSFAPPQPQPSTRVDAVGNGQFVSWETQSQSARPMAPPPASRQSAAADPLLSMFDAPSAGASQSDVLGLGVAPVPGDDMLAAFDAVPSAAPLASLPPMPAPAMPPQAPLPPAAAPLVDFNAPTLPGDDTFFAGIAQAPLSPAPVPVQPAAPLVARAFEEVPAAAPARAAQAPAPVGDASAEALRRAFLAGLGTPTLPLDALTPEMMERVGRLLREATQGTLDLLLARATTKREVRADVTMIVSSDNNPLKFSPDVAAALLHLLVPQGPGFLSPVAAMQDAYDDLRSHQFGFMAGLRAALAGVLKRFDPAMLEQRMAQKSMLDNVLPMNRRAKLWDLYIQLYRDIANEAEDDFHTLFGREFLRAYQEQVDRLEKSQ